MAFEDLAAFVRLLEKERELARVTAEVDPVLEVSEITHRVTRAGGPALLFERPKGSDVPVLINAYGSERRMRLVLGTDDVEGIGRHIVSLARPKIPKTLGEMVDSARLVKELLAYPPKTQKQGACQEVVLRGDEVDLSKLPILQCWPNDAGRYITLGQVVTTDPEGGDRNLGLYRMQVVDGRTTMMHWQSHKTGAAHYWRARQAGLERMPVSVAIGGDPVLPFCAAAPLPEGMDELLFAGFVRRTGVPLVPCVTNDLMVPANADIVLEGHVTIGEEATEGPFGDHTGYYSEPELYPVFHVDAITHKRNPIYHTTIVGVPPQEDAFLGKAIERIFLPLVQFLHPEIVDMNTPVEGGFHNLAIVSIKKRYAGQARKTMASIWGTGQLMFTKIVIVVDEWVNVHDLHEVLWAFTHCYDPARDTVLLEDFPVDDLEHASPVARIGGKVGIDATSKWRAEGHPRDWPEVIRMTDAVKDAVTRRWNEYGFGVPPLVDAPRAWFHPGALRGSTAWQELERAAQAAATRAGGRAEVVEGGDGRKRKGIWGRKE